MAGQNQNGFARNPVYCKIRLALTSSRIENKTSEKNVVCQHWPPGASERWTSPPRPRVQVRFDAHSDGVRVASTAAAAASSETRRFRFHQIVGGCSNFQMLVPLLVLLTWPPKTAIRHCHWFYTKPEITGDGISGGPDSFTYFGQFLSANQHTVPWLGQ